MKFSDLPTLGAEFEGGKFAGITTQKDGTPLQMIEALRVVMERGRCGDVV